MRRKAFFAVGFLAIGSMGLWASGNATTAQRLEAIADRFSMATRSAAAPDGTFGFVKVLNDVGASVIEAGWWAQTDQYFTRGDGSIGLADFYGNRRVITWADARDGGWVVVYDTGGQAAAYMNARDGFWSKRGDLAEHFPASVAGISAGSVVVLDLENPGSLTPSTRPYDRRVAGVVSGANNYKPGITLGSKTQVNGVPITLTGTAYCRVTGSIKAGDLLTTSSVPGHAMKATDREASPGAILGKAMEDFEGDRGLILILASLQ
jgi:hypothetical protein